MTLQPEPPQQFHHLCLTVCSIIMIVMIIICSHQTSPFGWLNPKARTGLASFPAFKFLRMGWSKWARFETNWCSHLFVRACHVSLTHDHQTNTITKDFRSVRRGNLILAMMVTFCCDPACVKEILSFAALLKVRWLSQNPVPEGILSLSASSLHHHRLGGSTHSFIHLSIHRSVHLFFHSTPPNPTLPTSVSRNLGMRERLAGLQSFGSSATLWCG